MFLLNFCSFEESIIKSRLKSCNIVICNKKEVVYNYIYYEFEKLGLIEWYYFYLGLLVFYYQQVEECDYFIGIVIEVEQQIVEFFQLSKNIIYWNSFFLIIKIYQ